MIVTLPLPETTNHGYATSKGRWYKTAKQTAWETEAGWIVKQTWKEKIITSSVSVGMSIFVKRDRDIDGSIKPVLDLLQRLKVYENDSQVIHLIVLKYVDKEFPRIELDIEKI